jgi:hypothetical protein
VAKVRIVQDFQCDCAFYPLPPGVFRVKDSLSIKALLVPDPANPEKNKIYH